MQWIRAHPYISALCAAALAILAGAWVVQKKSGAPVSNTATTWGGSNLGTLDPTSHAPSQNTDEEQGRDILQKVKDSPPYTYIPPAVFYDSSTETGESSFDLSNFISSLTAGTSGKPNSANDTAIGDAYVFIPSNLISSVSPQKDLSSAQQALYRYGNEVGSYIQSFDQQNPTAAIILRDQAEDRADPQKSAAVLELARALENVGQSLLNSIVDIPEGIAPTHATLAKSYIEIGKNLALVPKATSDTDFLNAIETYNASADTFVKNYIAFATLLGAYGITFDPNDAGSAFTFSPTSL